jgi:hypothetical protein
MERKRFLVRSIGALLGSAAATAWVVAGVGCGALLRQGAIVGSMTPGLSG